MRHSKIPQGGFADDVGGDWKRVAGGGKARAREQLQQEEWPSLGSEAYQSGRGDLNDSTTRERQPFATERNGNGFSTAHVPRGWTHLSRSASPADRSQQGVASRSAQRRRPQAEVASASRAASDSRRPAISNAAYSAALDVVGKKANNPRKVAAEFRRVQWRAGSNRKTTIADKPDSQAMNRYYDCVPFDFNRIILHREEEMDTGYINASHLKSPDEERPDWQYVVGQGPLFDGAGQFWEMVWITNSPIIIMLTQLKELDDQGEPIEKSALYWPEVVGQCGAFAQNIVTLEHKKDLGSGIICRKFSINNFLAEETRTVVHYQYLEWSDKSVPRPTSAVRQLLKIMDNMACIPRDSSGPPTIHCNSGIGRSCAFVAMSIVLRKLADLKPSDRAGGRGAVNMLDLLIALRKQRNSAIHTEQLLSFVYTVLTDEIEAILGYRD